MLPNRRGHMASYIARRKFLVTLLGGAAAWPLAARAQQAAMPVIGVLAPRSPDTFGEGYRAIRQVLKETGYVEGAIVAIEYRWADNQIDRLPALAADLVRRGVAVIIATGGHPPALAAKSATTTIPIVFVVPEDRARPCRQPRPTRRKPDRRQFLRGRIGSKAAGIPADSGAGGRSCGCARQSCQYYRDRVHSERRGVGCARHRTADAGPQRQHQSR